MPWNRTATVRTIAPVLAVALLAPACDDATGPARTVTLHLAHAAPGVGPFTLSIDDDVVAGSFAAGDRLITTVPEGRRVVSLDGGGDKIVKTARWSAGITPRRGLALLNPANPVLVTFDAPNEFDETPVALRVVNGVPGSSLTIEVSGAGTVTANLSYLGTSGSFGLEVGSYTVSAYYDDPESAFDLREVTLDEETRFLVVGPDESGTAPGFALAF